MKRPEELFLNSFVFFRLFREAGKINGFFFAILITRLGIPFIRKRENCFNRKEIISQSLNEFLFFIARLKLKVSLCQPLTFFFRSEASGGGWGSQG